MYETSHPSLDADHDIEPSALRDAGLRMALALDAGHGQQVWRAASVAVKELLSCDEFAHGVSARRKAAGKVRRREWHLVSRGISVQSGVNGLPPGVYACSEFTITFDDDRTGLEVVSFRLDEDGVWRFVGNHIEFREEPRPG
ncbi:DUF4019 domain-containing protein [Lysobacter arenosi]|uniref:DUF4019 domain-containing protein n=1 Tax=Lysobacter arenosi TaxID=2795387 RepID=A0ABX7RAZ9_9GAMM|nr:DUF4019 domain-containing protein [Lysobacter arenosi]QSX74683.1 DUF4019 domain-containing protein [Lysobacter arenosi]